MKKGMSRMSLFKKQIKTDGFVDEIVAMSILSNLEGIR